MNGMDQGRGDERFELSVAEARMLRIYLEDDEPEWVGPGTDELRDLVRRLQGFERNR